MYLVPLNYTLKNGYSGKFYVMCILSQFKNNVIHHAAAAAAAKLLQSCPTLSDPMDCSLPGSSIHGIFQARVLEWGAIAFSQFTILS